MPVTGCPRFHCRASQPNILAKGDKVITLLGMCKLANEYVCVVQYVGTAKHTQLFPLDLVAVRWQWLAGDSGEHRCRLSSCLDD